ncbi:hypothetical protein GCM10010399_43320 [Dactylosporangium fulvum]|uniref:Uncharacterized protein n=1 Tax=Dactylosporangium fulvum TaxID=53359 RepID=A0ABY5VZ05_9ACTN|nr:hypothetical protein [Dactylosporangium fulvum]UWP82900.1 hypothetical protein Dfulv_00880 [Dactylosporangium fulvum]
MGIKNRERRRAKQKARQQQQQGRRERAGSEFGDGAPADPAFADPFGLIDGGARPARVTALLVNEVLQALHVKDEDTVQRCCDVLAGGSGGTGGRRAVDTALIAALQRDLTEVWRRGWQPADVVRVAQRGYGARHGRVVVDVIAAEMRSYAAAAVDERWEAQVRDLGATVWWERDDQYLSALGEREGLARPALIRCVLEVLYVFNTCPPIQKLGPLPTRDATEQATKDMADRPGAERLLPVLASREAKVGEFVDELFPDLVGKQVAVTNQDGWASGRAAADRARLNARESLAAEA